MPSKEDGRGWLANGLGGMVFEDTNMSEISSPLSSDFTNP